MPSCARACRPRWRPRPRAGRRRHTQSEQRTGSATAATAAGRRSVHPHAWRRAPRGPLVWASIDMGKHQRCARAQRGGDAPRCGRRAGSHLHSTLGRVQRTQACLVQAPRCCFKAAPRAVHPGRQAGLEGQHDQARSCQGWDGKQRLGAHQAAAGRLCRGAAPAWRRLAGPARPGPAHAIYS